MANTATAKQIELINKLKDQKVWDEHCYDRTPEESEAYATEHPEAFNAGVHIRLGRSLWETEQFDKRIASLIIDALMACENKAETAPLASTTEPEAGVYLDVAEGLLYRIYKGQQSGRMLAKRIDTHSDGPLAEDQYVAYTYVGAAWRIFTDNFTRLSLAEVGDLGKKFDHCLCCGRRLDDPESVDRGVGPVCARKYEVA